MSLEFKNKTFPKVLRGYSPEEVENYLDYIDGEYKELERTAKQNEKRLAIALRKLDETSRRLEEYTKAEKDRAATEQQIIAEAEYVSKRLIAESKLKAAKIIKQATDTAESIMAQNELDLAESKKREESVYQSAQSIYAEVCKFRDSILDLYRVHLEAVDTLAEDAKEFAKSVDDVRVDLDDDDYSMFDITAEQTEEIAEEPEYGVEEPTAADEAEDCEDEDFSQTEEVFEIAEDAEDAIADEPVYEEYEEVEDPVDFVAEGEDFASVEGEDMYYADEDDGWYVAEEETIATGDLDDFFMDDISGEDMSLTDEFEIIFSNNSSKKNIDEIRRQPTVAAEEVPKHGWHDKKRYK